MLKGWFDCVFIYGWVYEFDVKGKVKGCLRDWFVLLVLFGVIDKEGYICYKYDRVFNIQVEYGIFLYCGFKDV